METIKSSLEKKGFSKQAIDLSLKSRRQSTVKNYGHKWEVWIKYCSSHTPVISPLKPSEQDFADFLASLFHKSDLKYRTVLNYKSAIVNTIKTATGVDPLNLSRSSTIQMVLDGIKNEMPLKCKQPPLWDVFLVLQHLTKTPFEPLEQCSLLHLTFKTVFLVSLASARRCSEVHALSGLEKDIEFMRGDTSVILSLLPEFRAKNQPSNSLPQVIEIKSLKGFVEDDNDDKLNCPVRVLKHYLKRTARFRGKKRRLFISINEHYEKDITKNTIARWILWLVKEVYKMANKENHHHFGMHEIRKVAASLAFVKGVSLQELMSTAYWRSQNTFSSFYLRDITTKRVNETYGISKLVVANAHLNF
jgi:hypothetical protein